MHGTDEGCDDGADEGSEDVSADWILIVATFESSAEQQEDPLYDDNRSPQVRFTVSNVAVCVDV